MRGSLQNHKFLPALLLVLALMVRSNLGDPIELVSNGNFEIQDKFDLDRFIEPFIDITPSIMDWVPSFRVVHNGVQLLNALTYHRPGMVVPEGLALCHMNTGHGPGVIHTVLVTPRRGIPLTLQFVMADNPDGGVSPKAMRVRILVNDRLSHPELKPFHVSSPYSTKSTIDWRVMNVSIVGTGEPTILQFESLMPGSYGPLLDNISVTVQNLIENGSFENTTGLVVSGLTAKAVISAPSQAFPGWSVTSGKIKWIQAISFEMSSDLSMHSLDLNAEAAAGTIASNRFRTKHGKKYGVLFDTAANALSVQTLEGYMSASAFSYPGGKLLASRSIFVSSEGQVPYNLGWMTYVLEFKAHGSESFIQFSSHMEGSWNGPLLDNVVVYEVHKPGRFKYIPPTWNAGRTPLKPSLWTISLTSALVMCVFGQFISEMLFLHG